MKKSLRVIPLLLGVVLLFSAGVVQADNLENVYVNKALKSFVSKDFDGAVKYLNQVMQINPQNKRAPKMLAKVHMKLAGRYYKGKQYDLAQEQVELALEFSPGNSAATTLSKKIVRKLSAAVVPSSGAQLPNVPAGGSFGGQIVVQTGEGVAEMGKEFANMMEKTNNNQTAVMQQIMRERAKQDSIAAWERRQAQDLLRAEAESKQSFLGNTLVVGAATIGGIVFLVVILFVVILKMFLKSSQLTQMQQTEAIKGLLSAPQMQLAALPPGMMGGQGSPLAITANAGRDSSQDLDSEDDMERANAVEAVMADIVSDNPDDVETHAKVEKVRELLNDSNNRVRANAAKAIHDVDPEAAIQALQGMLDSGSKRMMASSIWTLGEIADEPSLKLLLQYVDNEDEIIQYNVTTALQKVQEKEKFEIDKRDRTALVAAM